MEIQDTAFEGATKYTAESLGKCHQLADFIRKRQEIEEQYAKALRMTGESDRLGSVRRTDRHLLSARIGKLCKSVSLTPLQPPPSSGRRWFWRRRSGNGQAADSPSACSTPLEEVTRTYVDCSIGRWRRLTASFTGVFGRHFTKSLMTPRRWQSLTYDELLPLGLIS